MRFSTRWKAVAAGVAIVAIAVAAIGVTATMTGAVGGDDNEPPITGDALEKASAAALAHTGAGRVTETEVGDEDSYYEVEVTLDDGSQLDVQLDADFNVVGDEADSDGGGEDDGPDDD